MKIIKVLCMMAVLLCGCSKLAPKKENETFVLSIDSEQFELTLNEQNVYAFEHDFRLSTSSEVDTPYVMSVEGEFNIKNGAFVGMPDIVLKTFGVGIDAVNEWSLNATGTEISRLVQIKAENTQSFECDASMETVDKVFNMPNIKINYLNNYKEQGIICRFEMSIKKNTFNYKDPNCHVLMGYEKTGGESIDSTFYVSIRVVADNRIAISLY